MVRAIKVEDGGKTFYGTREAIYFLNLDEGNLPEFARDLRESMVRANEQIGSDSYYHLHFRELGGRNKRIDSDLSGANELMRVLNSTNNLLIARFTSSVGLADIVNLRSRFSRDDSNRDRSLEIAPFNVPNRVIEFDPSFLYEL